MPASVSAPRRLGFGSFEADLHSGELRKHGNKVRLQAQPFQLLAMLLERPGELVTRQEICARIWSKDTFVDFDQSLGTAVNKIREVLDDSATKPRFIETLPRRGYRFLAPVAVLERRDHEEVEKAVEEIEKPVENEPPKEEEVRRKIPSLRTFWAVTAAALVIATVTSWALLHPHSAPSIVGPLRAPTSADANSVRSIAVLPLVILSPNSGQQFFADGVTDELISNLAQIGSIRVISHTSATAYAKTDKPAPQIARELGVDALVEGSVSRSGNRVRITAQLIHAATDSHLWAHTYDLHMRDILTVQGQVAQDIAASISRTLTSEEKTRLSRPNPVSPEVALLYFKGSFFLSKLDTTKAKEMFSEAIRRDKDCAECWAGLADTFHTDGAVNGNYHAFTLARGAAERALKLDHSQAQALMVLGVVSFLYEWEPAKSEDFFRKSIGASPHFAMAHALFASTLAHRGRFDEALGQIKLATEDDPISVEANSFAWHVYFSARRYDEAIKVTQTFKEVDPTFQPTNWRLVRSWEQKGEYRKAIEAAGQEPSLKTAFALGGPRGYWQRKLEILLLHRSPNERYESSAVARCYMHLGKRQEALQALEKGYRLRDPYLIFWLPVDEEFDALRPDPRFQKMLRRLGIS